MFDYFVPAELEGSIKLGHLVNIPWRTKKVPGVVLALAEKQESTQFRARPIDAILEDTPLLTPAQMEFIKKFSGYYAVTPGSVARLMIPDRPNRASASKPSAYPDIPFSVSPSQLPKLKHAAETISPSPLGEGQGEGAQLVHIQDISSFVWFLHYLAKHDTRQLLVLIPTIEMILAIAGSMQKKYSEKISAVHSGLGKNAFWNAYRNILSGQSRIIFATRQGIFLPIQNKSHIIFFESSSDDFKQYDQHPRYDSRIAGAWLAEISGSKLLLASSSPDMGTDIGACADLPPARKQDTAIALVDMKNEMQRKDFSIIGSQTLDAIKNALAQHKKAVVIALREEPPPRPPLNTGGGKTRGVSVQSILGVLTQ
ncbi:MAG: hypothetical protein Q8Q97_02685, partial [bacterium]|nr:hypothetical protein [bacterium]